MCLLEEERDEECLQAVAREFNLSETCYLTRLTDSPESTNDSGNALSIPRFHLRWFTPVAEVVFYFIFLTFNFYVIVIFLFLFMFAVIINHCLQHDKWVMQGLLLVLMHIYHLYKT